MINIVMRIFEFDQKVDFVVKQFGGDSFRIAVISDLKIDRDALPEMYQTLFKLPNQIGIIDIGQTKNGYMEVENVFLAKEARRQGLGKMLYNKAIAYAKEEIGAKGVYSDPTNRNINSDAFWSSKAQSNIGGMDTRHDLFADK